MKIPKGQAAAVVNARGASSRAGVAPRASTPRGVQTSVYFSPAHISALDVRKRPGDSRSAVLERLLSRYLMLIKDAPVVRFTLPWGAWAVLQRLHATGTWTTMVHPEVLGLPDSLKLKILGWTIHERVAVVDVLDYLAHLDLDRPAEQTEARAILQGLGLLASSPA